MLFLSYEITRRAICANVFVCVTYFPFTILRRINKFPLFSCTICRRAPIRPILIGSLFYFPGILCAPLVIILYYLPICDISIYALPIVLFDLLYRGNYLP